MSVAEQLAAAPAREWARKLVGRAESPGVRAAPPPPNCPTGWFTGAPDFVGVGSQRCGTTRWFDLITAHPEVISPSVTKELHYFDRFYTGTFTAEDRDGYHRYFPRDGSRLIGEWTPLYMAAPWVPPLLASSAPDARLLVILRDPVERYLSGLAHDVGLAAKRREVLSEFAPLQTFMRGLYHAQLTGLLDHFERSQLLVLQFERCAREPEVELDRTYRFLGLADIGQRPDLDSHPHRQPAKPELGQEQRKALARAYEDDVTRLIADFPEIDINLWPTFAG